jgi:uncharacterized membrane protein HdeD (DUF308 family)
MGRASAHQTAAGARGLSLHHGGSGMHAAINLLPEWLGIVGVVVFLGIAASHLRHVARTDGQRRPWHACHVLIAVGMAFMYAPAVIDSLAVPAVFWQLVFVSTGVLAALWALGGVGRVPTLMWLLTSIDLAAMIYMWSPHSAAAALGWLLAGYFVAQGAMWSADAYRRLDGHTPIISWNLMSDTSGSATVTVPVARTVASDSLIGELDIGLSMIAMTLGMAYMLVAMLAS